VRAARAPQRAAGLPARHLPARIPAEVGVPDDRAADLRRRRGVVPAAVRPASRRTAPGPGRLLRRGRLARLVARPDRQLLGGPGGHEPPPPRRRTAPARAGPPRPGAAAARGGAALAGGGLGPGAVRRRRGNRPRLPAPGGG